MIVTLFFRRIQVPSRNSVTRLCFCPVLAAFGRHFGARLARFRKADSDGLLSRCHDPALSAFAGTKCAELFPMQGAFDTFARSFTIFPSGPFFLRHVIRSY